MTTGATGQLGLALPVQGELSGTWGNTVNNGITEYTNIAIAATLTLTNDGAVTLANTTGDAAATNIVSSLTGAGTVTAQFAIVKVTGTLTTPKIITAPSYSKTYLVVNAATGSTVSFIRSGQTPAVSIAVGESAYVYYNGTDYVKVAGTAAVTSFTAGTTGFTPSTATTGAVTLAGTLATTNGGTGLTSFTANGVVYASSTSTLATGSALTFNNFNLVTSSGASSTAVQLQNNTAQMQIVVPTSGGSNIQFYKDNSPTYVGAIGTYNPLNNTAQSALVFSDYQGSWTERMRLTSAGNLGIGTNNPSGAKLTVTASSGSIGLFTQTSATGYGLTIVPGADSTYDAFTINNAANTINAIRMFGNGNATFSGSVGIGTSSPGSPLTVSTTGVNSTVQINSTDGAGGYGAVLSLNNTGTGGRDYYITSTSNADGGVGGGKLKFYDNIAGTTRMLIDASGNVGVGVTPSAWSGTGAKGLQVGTALSLGYSNSTGSFVGGNTYFGGDWKRITTGAATAYLLGGDGTHLWYQTATSSSANSTISFTQAMTLNASGNLGVGTTSPDARIDAEVSSGNGYRAYKSTTGGFTAYRLYTSNENVIGTIGVTSTNDTFYLGYTSTPVLTWNSSGRVGIGTSSPGRAIELYNSQPAFKFNNGTYNWTLGTGAFIDGSDSFNIYSGTLGLNVLRLDGAGNMGLGVTPNVWNAYTALQIGNASVANYNPSGDFNLASNAYFYNTFKYITSGLKSSKLQLANGAHQFYISTDGTQTADATISYTQAMTLDNSGRLLIGKTATGLGTIGIEINPNGYGQYTVSGDASLFTNRLGSDGDTIKFYRQTSLVGSISVTSTLTSYNVTSDQRLKINIVDAPDGNIDQIKIRSFDWKANNSHNTYGVIAQELLEVAPYAVHQPENSDEMMGVDYSKLVPMMIKEIQSLKQRISTLENK